MRRIAPPPAALKAAAACLLLASASTPAAADTTSFRDPRGDAPARYDLTAVTVANTTDNLTVRVRVRDLLARGTQITGVGISSPDGSSYYILHSIRRASGATTSKLTDYSVGADPVACRIASNWAPRADVIRISMPRTCVANRGALKVAVFLGAGDGSSGDPADNTKTIRIGQS